jgi:hypothetical protein
MYKLSEDINKSVLFNEFMKKINFSNIPRLLKQRSDMRNLMKVGEAKGVFKDRSKWKVVISVHDLFGK